MRALVNNVKPTNFKNFKEMHQGIELLKKNTPKTVCIQILWDIISDLNFYDFTNLLEIASKIVKDEPVLSLLNLMTCSGYSEYIKNPIQLPSSKSNEIIQKLLILDLIEIANGKSILDFKTLKSITHCKSEQDLVEFLILVLTSKGIHGKINIQDKVLTINSVISRNSGNLQDLILDLSNYSVKISNTISILENQQDKMSLYMENWKKEEEDYQDSLKNVSDKVKRQFKS